MSKTWKLKDAPSELELEAYEGLNPTVAQLLWQRGVGADEAEEFLHISYSAQYDPFVFTDMRKAVDRVWQAIEAGEKIVIYGDYDADAVTANSVLQQTFRYLGVDAGSYVPDRFTEGYGLNIDAFEKIKADGAQVVVTVDCGTNSVDVAEWCKANNIDLIITDHHEITGATPQSYALVNPKNPADVYPDPQITGVGVAYKFAKALLSYEDRVRARFAPVRHSEGGLATEESNGENNEILHPGQGVGAQDDGRRYVENWDKWLLDLVAIGTVADCHSLLGENRIFVKYGLLVLAKTKWLGLRALLDTVVGRDAELSTHTLGWLLAPRINAAGRLEHANIALDTLLATDPITAQQTAQALEQVNTRRQDLTARLISEAREQAVLQQQYKILVLASQDWPKGIVGIAAGRLANEFGKPVIVLEKGEQECTGSARTFGNFNVVEALKASSQFLSKFGGHKEAAGLTLLTSELEAFKASIVKYAEEAIGAGADADVALELDAELSGQDLHLDFFDTLEQLAPFGAGNPKPVFWLRNATIATLKKVGSEGQHAQVTFDIAGKQVQSIGFSMGYVCDSFAVGSTIDIAAELLADTWNGVRRLKLRLLDIRTAV